MKEVGTTRERMYTSDLSYNLLFFQNDNGICIQYNRKIIQKVYISIIFLAFSFGVGEEGRKISEKNIKNVLKLASMDTK